MFTIKSINNLNPAARESDLDRVYCFIMANKDNDESITMQEMEELSDSIYYLEDTNNSNVVGVICGFRYSVEDDYNPMAKRYPNVYLIKYFLMDCYYCDSEEYASSLAALVREYLADKNDWSTRYAITGKEHKVLIRALRANNFIRHREELYYLRLPHVDTSTVYY